MPRFFVSRESIDKEKGEIVLTGENAHHISTSLRMKPLDRLTVCDGERNEYDCVIASFDRENVRAKIEERHESASEPPFFATIYQGLPKGDKIDAIIQKSVECGASALVTFESEFCVAREKSESRDRKLDRRRKIALEAAKQCGRGLVPEVLPTVGFAEAVRAASKADLPLFCYEGDGTLPLKTLVRTRLSKNEKQGNVRADAGLTVSVVIGSEGGFSAREAEFAKENGMLMTGLGKRILRTETVSEFVLAALVYELEM